MPKAQPWEASRSPHWWFPPTCCLALGLGENVGRQDKPVVPSSYNQPLRGRGHVTPKMSPSQGDPGPSGDGSKVSFQGPPGPEKVQMSQHGCCPGNSHPGFPPGACAPGPGAAEPYFKCEGTQAPTCGSWPGQAWRHGETEASPLSHPPPTKVTGCPGPQQTPASLRPGPLEASDEEQAARTAIAPGTHRLPSTSTGLL